MSTTTLSQSSTGREPLLCAFCGRNFSRYTCPGCNAAYCSLSCYRSQVHSQCAEPFYRKATEDELRMNSKTRTKEEREGVIDMLMRLEEEGFEDHMDTNDSNNKECSLATRLQNLDLDAATPDELWGALNDEERAAFTTLLRDPTSEAAKGVLALYDSQSQSWRPWWELEHGEEKDSSYQKMVASWESFDIALSALSAPFGKHANSCRLVYNIVAIILSYAFTIRHLVISPLSISRGHSDDQDASRKDIARTAPFLFDHRSTVAFRNIDEATTDIWSRIGSVSSAFMIQLLRDALVLLNVPLIRPQNNAPPTPLSLVFSDLFHLFRHCSVVRPDPTAMKLKFYAAQVPLIPASTFNGLRLEVENQIQKIMTIEQEKRTFDVIFPALTIDGIVSEQRRPGPQASQNPSVEEI